MAGLFSAAPEKAYVRQFAAELLKGFGSDGPPAGFESEDDLIFWLQEEGYLFRCDWKDTVGSCGEEIAAFACKAGANKVIVDECLDRQDKSDPIFEYARALHDAMASDGLTLLEIDEQSDGWLYCVARPEFLARWVDTCLSKSVTVFRPKSAKERVPRGLHDGPRETEGDQ
ncbi:hypothetical protein LCL97_05625 [Seohaeicola saemankumensis]|nr:hypothetical protein [Seohaeicola saemankumensis]MCA0870292.1 hypothetical protein [Seohaeicola saemankumensis]